MVLLGKVPTHQLMTVAAGRASRRVLAESVCGWAELCRIDSRLWMPWFLGDPVCVISLCSWFSLLFRVSRSLSKPVAQCSRCVVGEVPSCGLCVQAIVSWQIIINNNLFQKKLFFEEECPVIGGVDFDLISFHF